MAYKFVLPTPDSVSSLLGIIFGEEMASEDSDSVDAGSSYTATFLSDEDELVAVCMCDKAFVARSGAALSMLPPDVAQEMIDDDDISDVVSQNFYEVMNICSKLMMSDESSHLRLDKVLPPSAADDAVSSVQSSGTTKSFKVTIPGYGDGITTFVVC